MTTGPKPTLSELFDEVETERGAQDEKWGRDFNGRDPNTWLAILIEEVGEAAAEDDVERLIVELVQVAAVALSWAEHAHAQGRTNQYPEGAILRLHALQLEDEARAALAVKGIS